MNPQDDRREAATPRAPLESIAYRDVDSQMGDFARTVELNERILRSLQEFELMLLDATGLAALLDVLLNSTAKHFGLNGVSLSLYDPDGTLASLLPEASELGFDFTLDSDNFDMQQLYGARPEVEFIASTDPRALRAIANVDTGRCALLLPLVRDGVVIGSFHWVSDDATAFATDTEKEFLNHLAAIIAICLDNCINCERLAQLSLLDPLTRLSNFRAFEMELRKELARAHRSQKPLTLLLMEVDDFKSIRDNYGHLSADFVLKRLTSHIVSMLRSTDYIARLKGPRFAVLLPACVESKAQEIAERMRSDTEFVEIDDGRGAQLFASLSIGLSSWVPQNYPAINMEQLAGQLKAVAAQALEKSLDGGGNRLSVTRLSAMLV